MRMALFRGDQVDLCGNILIWAGGNSLNCTARSTPASGESQLTIER